MMQQNLNANLNIDRITAIHTPEIGQVRVRKIVKRSNSYSTGKYPSWKMGRMVQWKSPRLLAAFRLLDATPAVKSYQEEAMRVDYCYQGQEKSFYPDLLVQINDHQELWSINTEKLANSPDEIALAQFLKRELYRHGLNYRVVIAESLIEEPLQSNITRLIEFGRNPASAIDREQVRQLLTRCDAIDWETVSNGLLGPNGRQVICRLALEGIMRFNIKEIWSGSTRFQLNTAFSAMGAR